MEHRGYTHMNYSAYIIDRGATVAEALAQLERGGHKILFIAPDDKLWGVVTDGDIRRYLLANGAMDQPIGAAASDTPIFVRGFHEARARELLEENDITCVPMVDRDDRIHALVFKHETVHRAARKIDVPVIMMAGGLGTRLLPYTEILPKPLIPVGSMTITEQILNRFKKFGCTHCSIVVNYKRNLIKSYFSEVDPGMQLEFVDEDKPLGTGGGLCFFKGKLNGPAFVTNCDSVIEADYEEILDLHRRTGSILTMVCARKQMCVPYGVVEANEDGEVTDLLEKPSYDLLINTGFYVVSPEFVESIPDDTFTPITEAVERCRAAGKRVSAYVVDDECFIDIGQLEDLKQVEGKLQ